MFIDDRPKRMTMLESSQAQRIIRGDRLREQEKGQTARQEIYTRADPGSCELATAN